VRYTRRCRFLLPIYVWSTVASAGTVVRQSEANTTAITFENVILVMVMPLLLVRAARCAPLFQAGCIIHRFQSTAMSKTTSNSSLCIGGIAQCVFSVSLQIGTVKWLRAAELHCADSAGKLAAAAFSDGRESAPPLARAR
jgi:hypothetical protein